MQVQLANQTVELNEEGYLEDMWQWTPEMAHEIADVEGIELSDKHFEVIEFLREQQAEGAKLTIRRVGNSGIVSIKEFYELFPSAPLKKASKIAGIPKPESCV